MATTFVRFEPPASRRRPPTAAFDANEAGFLIEPQAARERTRGSNDRYCL